METVEENMMERLKKKFDIGYLEDLTQQQRVAEVGIWKYDLIKDKIFWSDEIYKIFGIDIEDFDKTHDNFLNLINPKDKENVKNALDLCRKGKDYYLEYGIPQKNKSEKYVISKGQALTNDQGEIIGIMGTLQDITEDKKLKDKINSMQKSFKILIEESNDIYQIIDSNGKIKYVNKAISKLTGYEIDELIGSSIDKFFKGDSLKKLLDMVDFVVDNEEQRVKAEISFETKKGNSVYFEVIMQNLSKEAFIKGIVITYRDITDRVEIEKKMVHISTHDELTDLPNKTYFNSKLRKEYQYAKKEKVGFGLVMMDIGGLKYVNYSLGYEMGDKLIIKAVKRLRKFLNRDHFISRYSDDHFAIIIPQLDSKEEYKRFLEGIIKLFSTPFKVEGYELNLSVNLGICTYAGNTKDMDTLIDQTQLALLRAKKNRKNTYQFHTANIDVQNYKESILRTDLYYAIEKKQLIVYYQPIINVGTSEVLGAEALIRWEHPKWGIVSPDEFIPMAEETGLIINIGKWVLEEVCKDYKKWIKGGFPKIKLSVNFSSVQFLEENFVDDIKNIIDKYKLDPKFLIMEITESILFKNVKKIISDIRSIQSLGIQVAFDDFGTGFSSFEYLNSFNINIIKIGETFIKNIPDDSTSTIIIKNIINLAKELKIKLVAEGIENWQQLFYLRGLNCYAGQGYIYSRPVPRKEFEKILSERICSPKLVKNRETIINEENPDFFRIKFHQLLEADMTILKFNQEKVDIGNTKVLIKNIGLGGLSFISTIKFPVDQGLILQLLTRLIEEELRTCGHITSIEEVGHDLYEYYLKFTLDENQRCNLVKLLNKVQARMKDKVIFSDGDFVSLSPNLYFASINKKNR